MDPKHSGDVLKHLDKLLELQTDAYNSMSRELHELQVEEQMLMRKYYEFMAAQGLTHKKKDSAIVTEHGETSKAGAFVSVGEEEEEP